MSSESIQPVVLVGGRSRRFGADKLLAAWRGDEGGERLVDQPRRVLRAVLGAEPWAVGRCAPEVASRFARVIEERCPGLGPAGGIVAALEAAPASILVLSGDLPRIDRASIRALVEAGIADPGADAVVAAAGPRADDAAERRDHLEPCIALYRRSALAPLARLTEPAVAPGLDAVRVGIEARRRGGDAPRRDAAGAETPRSPPLHAALAELRIVIVPIDAARAVNVNAPEDLASLQAAPIR